MTEEEKFHAYLHELFEKFVYSSKDACLQFAYAGSTKCRQVLRDRYNVKLQAARKRSCDMTAEELRERKERYNARQREYYYKHREKRRAQKREYMKTYGWRARLAREQENLIAAGKSSSL